MLALRRWSGIDRHRVAFRRRTGVHVAQWLITKRGRPAHRDHAGRRHGVQEPHRRAVVGEAHRNRRLAGLLQPIEERPAHRRAAARLADHDAAVVERPAPRPALATRALRLQVRQRLGAVIGLRPGGLPAQQQGHGQRRGLQPAGPRAAAPGPARPLETAKTPRQGGCCVFMQRSSQAGRHASVTPARYPPPKLGGAARQQSPVRHHRLAKTRVELRRQFALQRAVDPEDRKFNPTFFSQSPPSMLLNTLWCGPWARQRSVEGRSQPKRASSVATVSGFSLSISRRTSALRSCGAVDLRGPVHRAA